MFAPEILRRSPTCRTYALYELTLVWITIFGRFRLLAIARSAVPKGQSNFFGGSLLLVRLETSSFNA
ncbi:hypothetical protein [Scytonema sp. HK-05]|uniref:hypothetical protein n=1 Tax=Scytonema sp. HK-05 TaxID=1137095 RepID=UPI0011613856|nr:hypothetical protein [Scytonema sp. HK-05]